MRFILGGFMILLVSFLSIHFLFAQDAEESKAVGLEDLAGGRVTLPDPTNAPPKLQSVIAKEATNAPPRAPRIPVYVLPEVIEVRIPGGMRFIFVEQHHMQELAKKFPAIRYTNIIIYADGL